MFETLELVTNVTLEIIYYYYIIFCQVLSSGWPHKSQNKIPGVFQVFPGSIRKIPVFCNDTFYQEMTLLTPAHEIAAQNSEKQSQDGIK